MSGPIRIAAVLLGFALMGSGWAQSSGKPAVGAHIRFTMEDSQLQPRAYTLEINEDGSGSYTATYASTVAGDPTVQEVKQPIRIREPLLARLFQTARKEHFFESNCADKRRNVAFTGKKTLAYEGPDGSGSCTFNYSREREVNQIALGLAAVGYTLQVGKRLKQEHRYNRLSLDDELHSLQQAVEEGRALEPENIAPELQAIANDNGVLDLARARARSLLEKTIAVR